MARFPISYVIYIYIYILYPVAPWEIHSARQENEASLLALVLQYFIGGYLYWHRGAGVLVLYTGLYGVGKRRCR